MFIKFNCKCYLASDVVTNNKLAFEFEGKWSIYKTNDFVLALNGTIVVTDTSVIYLMKFTMFIFGE